MLGVACLRLPNTSREQRVLARNVYMPVTFLQAILVPIDAALAGLVALPSLFVVVIQTHVSQHELHEGCLAEGLLGSMVFISGIAMAVKE